MYNKIWSPLKQEFVPTLSDDGKNALKMYVNSFMTGGGPEEMVKVAKTAQDLATAVKAAATALKGGITMVCDIGGGSATFYLIIDGVYTGVKIKGKELIKKGELKVDLQLFHDDKGGHNKHFINAIGHVLSNMNEDGEINKEPIRAYINNLRSKAEAGTLINYYEKLIKEELIKENSSLYTQRDLLAEYFAMEVAAAVAEANGKGHGNVNNLIIKQTGDIRALMLGYRDPAVNKDAKPGTQEGYDNSGEFLDKCKQALHTMLSPQSTEVTGGGEKVTSNLPEIEWEFLTNEKEAELEMERWVVELNEPNRTGIDKIVHSTGLAKRENVLDGYVMVNIGSSSTQIGVVKKVSNGEQESFKLEYFNGINYCGAKDASFNALEDALKKVLDDAYVKGGRHFIFRNAIGYAFNKFKAIDLKNNNSEDIYVQLTPNTLQSSAGKMSNIVHLNKTSYDILVDKDVDKDIKIFLKGCSDLMGKEKMVSEEEKVTLHLIPAQHDKSNPGAPLFDPQWAYAVITRNGGTFKLASP